MPNDPRRLYGPIRRCPRCQEVLKPQPQQHWCKGCPWSIRPASFFRMLSAFVEFVDATDAYDRDRRQGE